MKKIFILILALTLTGAKISSFNHPNTCAKVYHSPNGILGLHASLTTLNSDLHVVIALSHKGSLISGLSTCLRHISYF